MKIKPNCENHKPYYCLKTGGLRCRKCKTLLNDFGSEYTITKPMKTPKYQQSNSEQNPERSVATEDDSSTKVD